MAETRIADIIVPEVWAPYVVQKSVEISALFKSGLVAADPRIEVGSRQGGETVNMPFWSDLDGEAEELSDQKALTPSKIGTGEDVAVMQALGKAFSSNDLAEALNVDREDPAEVIASLVAWFWDRNMQYRVISQLQGAFAAANMSDNILDISGLVAGAAVIDKVSFADASFVLGDKYESLSSVAMHSKTYSKLYIDDLIETVKGSDGKSFPSYQGKRVILDDGCPVSSGVYTTYLFGPGAVGYAEGDPKVPAETDRDSLAGVDVLISRRHFVLHVRGVKWVGTATISTGDEIGGHPTRAELATGANWTRVYDPKNIRVVAFKHRIAAA